MSDLTLTDVTQVLLKQNQELTVNTAETKDTKAGIAELSKVLGDYFKNQQRLDEGDRLENKREASSAKAGGGNLSDALTGSGLTAANTATGFLGAITGILIGFTTEFIISLRNGVRLLGKIPFVARIVKAIKDFITAVRVGFMLGLNPKKVRDMIKAAGFVGPPKPLSDFLLRVSEFFRRFGVRLRVFLRKFRRFTRPIMNGITAMTNAVRSISNAIFTRMISPFTNAAASINKSLQSAGKAGQTVQKFFGIVRSFFPAMLKAFGTFARVFSLLGRVIFLPINIIIGIVQGIRGFIEGFTQSREAGEGYFSSVMSGVLEGIKKAINTLIMYPLDLLKNGIAFLLNAIGLEGAAELLKGFSFASLFGGLIDGIKTIFSGLSDNILLGLITLVGRLAKLPAALGAASLHAIAAGIAPGGLSAGEAFSKTFNSVLKFGEGGPTPTEDGGTQRRREDIEETMLERQAQQGQGGGATIVDGSSNIQNNGDSVQLSTQVDDTQNSADRMKRGSRGSRGR